MTTDEALKDAWRHGYQTAVDIMRSWADEFANEECKQTILTCADMIDAGKPPAEEGVL